jgi:uncharacterized protein YbaP (TraB family)
MVSDNDTRIYLMGTVHLTSGIANWQSTEFAEIWNEVDTVYLETDVATGNPQARMQALVPTYGLNPAGKTLASYFSEDEVRTLDEILTPINLSIAAMAPLRPWLANLQAGVSSLVSAGIDPAASIDRTIASMALEAEKKLRSFETLEEQIQLIAGANDQDVARYMLRTADQQWTHAAQYIEDLSMAWVQGDDQRIAEIVARDFDGYPDAAARLLYNRNDRWASELLSVLENESGVFFVAVGAGHLVGERSLQDYLESIGVEVRKGIGNERRFDIKKSVHHNCRCNNRRYRFSCSCIGWLGCAASGLCRPASIC